MRPDTHAQQVRKWTKTKEIQATRRHTLTTRLGNLTTRGANLAIYMTSSGRGEEGHHQRGGVGGTCRWRLSLCQRGHDRRSTRLRWARCAKLFSHARKEKRIRSMLLCAVASEGRTRSEQIKRAHETDSNDRFVTPWSLQKGGGSPFRSIWNRVAAS